MSIETDIEQMAVRLAHAAGERITAALGESFHVEFKEAFSGKASNSNPVSEVDRAVEAFIRAELSKAFPAHAIIGEEKGSSDHQDADYTWVIDPVDGTTNFINGLPLFASSIGVLHQHRPIVGAIWCVSSHALRPGVYHAHQGGTLHFDGQPVRRREAAHWRGIASLPRHMRGLGAHWDVRVTGSATIELAFVAAGILRLAYISRPSLWDAAGGAVLAAAAGCSIMTQQDSRWQPLTRFDILEDWRQPVLVGDREAVQLAMDANPTP